VSTSRRRHTVSRGTPRRKFIWARQAGLVSGGPASGGEVDLLQLFNQTYGADLVGATVMRIRGIMAVRSANIGQHLVAGVRVMADGGPPFSATTEGPNVQPFADWMLYEPFTTDVASGNSTDVSARVIDVKSARKLEELGDGLRLQWNMPPGNVVTVTFDYTLSIGLKLP